MSCTWYKKQLVCAALQSDASIVAERKSQTWSHACVWANVTSGDSKQPDATHVVQTSRHDRNQAEQKLNQMMTENAELVQRLVEMKATEVERMNEVNRTCDEMVSLVHLSAVDLPFAAYLSLTEQACSCNALCIAYPPKVVQSVAS